MTRDEIIRMARAAGHPLDEAQSDIVLRFQAVLADFAQAAYAAGAAAEREACIQKIREELDQAERNTMRLEGQAGVRVSMIEAALDWMRARGET
jgi:hypothetical protein